MPGPVPNPEFLTTPGRQTQVHFDLPGTERKSTYTGGFRRGNQIAVGVSGTGRESLDAQNMRYWPASGAWTLRPIQESLSTFQSPLPIGVAADDILLKPHVTNIIGTLGTSIEVITEILAWSKPYGVGMIHRPDMPDVADKFWLKTVPAGEDWNVGILSVSPPPPQDDWIGTDKEIVAPMQTVLCPPITFRADQGFCLRWIIPGTPLHYPDYVLNFSFGQYCLAIKGDGLAELYEYVTSVGWQLRKTFRYCNPAQVVSVSHTIIIFPLLGMRGEKRIHFAGNHIETAKSASQYVNVPMMEEVWQANPFTRNLDPDQSPGHVTKAGTARLDVRHDLRIGWQVSPLLFQPSGTLRDSAFMLDAVMDPGPVKTQVWSRMPTYSDTDPLIPSITTTVLDASLGIEIPPGTDVFGNVFARFDFQGQSKRWDNLAQDTPVLYGYWLYKAATTTDNYPTPQTFSINEFTAMTQGRDAATEHGALLCTDLLGTARLKSRGIVPVKVVVDVPVDSETTAKITLFRGDAIRPNRTRCGRPNQREGLANAGSPVLYPSPEWSQYQCQLQGMAKRIDEVSSKYNTDQEFAVDESAPYDETIQSKPPWKVTDVIKFLLTNVGGEPEERVDIPDNPIRLFPGIAPSDVMAYRWETADNNLFDRIVRLARHYLGAYLIYDLSRGVIVDDDTRPDFGSPEGAWTLIYPAPLGADPIFNFVTAPDDPSKIDNIPESYPPDTTFVTDRQESYVVPPEFNHLKVFCAPPQAGETGFSFYKEFVNPHSYEVPGRAALGLPAPDPDSPHYIGREVYYHHVDFGLYIEGDPQATEAALSFIGNRLMRYAGCGQTVRPVRGPLAMILDAETDRYRFLRFGDPVSYNGDPGWFVGSVIPDFHLDTCQLAHYELIKPEPI